MTRLKRLALFVALPALAISALSLLFVGFEFHTGDHETGNYHTAFVKTAPTTTLRFYDPFQGGDRGGNPDRLSSEARLQFIDYCRYKMGVPAGDIHQCFVQYQASACAKDYVSRGIDCPPDSVFSRNKARSSVN